MARPALSATRAVDVLNFMAANPLEAYSLSELAEHLALNVSSCHALLAALTRDGCLERHPKHRTYRLGVALIAIGDGALQCHRAVDIGRDQARELARELDLETLLTSRVGDRLLALARSGRPSSPAASLRVGQSMPLVPPLGTPFIAWAPPNEVEAWLARSPVPLDRIARSRYLESLELVRQRGFFVSLRNPAQTRLGETVLGLSSMPHSADLQNRVAALIGELGDEYLLGELEPDARYPASMLSVPIFDGHGRVSYTLALLGFRDALSASELQHYAERLAHAAGMVMHLTGGRAPRAIETAAKPKVATPVVRKSKARA
ncbi:MAG TPA: helix-turn-helix domain-containing protein [Alphaproteobacteria bacterium]|nr:helix-turn-helix domain-containing protein [Alphaproteobacteria bacterium]